MKKLRLNKALIASLTFALSIVLGTTVVDAANASGANSQATVEFYGKANGSGSNSNDSQNSSNSLAYSGVSNDKLPQTGDFVVPGISLIGYTSLTLGILLAIASLKSQKNYESGKGE